MVTEYLIYIAYWLLILGSCLASHWIFRRSTKAAWALFLWIPLILTPFWILYNSDYKQFLWAKMYSVILAACLILILRTHKLNKLKFLVYLILAVNILEAVIQGLYCDNTASILNAMSGILLILTLPKTKSLSVDPHGYHDFLWDVPYGWIIGYTGWNWIFTTQCLGGSYTIMALLLLAPLLIACKNRALWLQARICSLGFFLIAYFSQFNDAKTMLHSPQIPPGILLGLSIFFFVWMLRHTAKTVEKSWL